MNEDLTARENGTEANLPPQHEDTVLFPIDDEFTARDIESDTQRALPEEDSVLEDAHQSSISELDDTIPESTDVLETVVVDIPSDEDDDELAPITNKNDDAREKAERPIDNRFDFLELFVFTMVAVLILTAFVFRHSIVDGDSMANTLYDGEHMIISDFFYTPKRGDIIVFQDYSKAEYNEALKAPLVKRVIAVGGDTIRIYFDGRVYVNDMENPIVEDYVYYLRADKLLPDAYAEQIPGYTYQKKAVGRGYEYIECTVPEGEVFVMGDHRDESTDSRAFGTVKESTILGRALFRFYPFGSAGVID